MKDIVETEIKNLLDKVLLRFQSLFREEKERKCTIFRLCLTFLVLLIE